MEVKMSSQPLDTCSRSSGEISGDPDWSYRFGKLAYEWYFNL